MKIPQILDEQISKIKPSSQEIAHLENSANNFIHLLEKNKLKAKIGGSLAKGTMIKKNEKQDVDIFVIFDYSEDILNLESILKKIKLPGKMKKIHGSRDYFQIECDDVILEIIPVVDNKNPALAENVTDVSLSHVKYVREKIKKNSNIADDIRLAKAFCRSQNCYGAESYIKGFSGYALEILVIYFGSFIKFLKKISKEKIIDSEKYFRNEKEILREINSSKLQSPIILIDPTYKYRNITAGLSEETFNKFLESAKNFLKSPSIDFFKIKNIDENEPKNFAEKNHAKLLELRLSTTRQEGDIAGTKMRKFFDFLNSELKRKQQEILRKEFYYSGKGKSAFGYIVVKEKNEIEICGPDVGRESDILNFKKNHKEIYKKGSRYYAKEKINVAKIFKKTKKTQKEMEVEAKMKEQ